MPITYKTQIIDNELFYITTYTHEFKSESKTKDCEELKQLIDRHGYAVPSEFTKIKNVLNTSNAVPDLISISLKESAIDFQKRLIIYNNTHKEDIGLLHYLKNYYKNLSKQLMSKVTSVNTDKDTDYSIVIEATMKADLFEKLYAKVKNEFKNEYIDDDMFDDENDEI